MDLERERRLLALVEEGLDLQADARAAYLERATDDVELRREVLELIAREERGEHMTPVGVPSELLADLASTLGARTVIDGFQVVGVLGTGGMGRVFEARQLEPARHVALKTLRVGLDSDESRRRFAFEAEVLARLRHPNIAQVYAVGTFTEQGLGGPREVPYFAMEFVEGARDLLVHADRADLDRRGRIELALDVCDAVQHGHDRGVLHRDLKPSNLLVGPDGRLKVIDFGIARPVAVDGDPEPSDGGPPRTASGAVYGTPGALSPEQLAGEADVDVRADVYALGVLLYRLLCGAPPHDLEGLTLVSAARQVMEHEPRRPSRLVSALPRDLAVPRDLEAVLLMAVARDRGDRYPSVAALADDLRRFLADEPVAARPPGSLHALRLLVRRHRVATAAGVVSLVAILAGAGASASFGLEASRAAVAADQARSELADLSLDFVFRFADPIADLQGATGVRAELLRTGVEHLESLDELMLDDLERALLLVRAYLKLGDIQGASNQGNVGDFEGRRVAHERAASVLESIGERWPEDPRLPTFRAAVSSRQGQASLDAGDREAAYVHFERALEESRSRVEGRAIDEELSSDLSLALSNFGALRGMLGDDDGALAAFEEARTLRGALLAIAPGIVDLRRDFAHSCAQTGAALSRSGRFEAALERYTEAIAIFDQLARDEPALDTGLRGGIETRGALCLVCVEHEQLDTGERVGHEALERVAELSGRDPEDVSVDRFAGDLRFSLARIALLRGDGAEVEAARIEHFERAHEGFLASRAAFERLRDGGALLPREHGYFGVIDQMLAEVERLLDS